MKFLILFIVLFSTIQAASSQLEICSSQFDFKKFLNKVDHFNDTDTRFYNHTYYTNFSFNQSSDSINVLELLAPEDYIVRSYMQVKEKGALFNFSQEWKAKMFQLEHRYYANSQPFPNTKHLADFQYLTTNQVLEDIHQFIGKRIQKDKIYGKWLIQGTGYAGSLAVWYKQKYPHEDVVAVWASSAPLKIQELYTGADQNTLNAVNRVNSSYLDINFPECQKSLSSITNDLMRIIHNDDTLLKSYVFTTFIYFGGDLKETDFAIFLSELFTYNIKRNESNNSPNLNVMEKMCLDISNPYPNIRKVLERLGYMQAYLGLDYKHYDAAYVKQYGFYDEMPSKFWRYQQCTELGWFNAPLPDYPYSSKILTKEAYADYCRRIFGDDVPALDITKSAQYNQLDIKADNVLLVSQSLDPWQYATILNSTKPGIKTVYIDCYPKCTFGIDVYADYTTPEVHPAALTEAWSEIKTTLEQWIS